MSWDMIGHKWAETLLKKHINTGQVRHAYLISGENGVGKRTLATQFAIALNCAHADSPGESCGACRACRLIPAGAYPDFHVLEPEEDSRSIKVEQVREFLKQLALSPFEGRWRIALIPDFEIATDKAANAFLKTLEEPSASVIIVITAIDAESLLPTIVSRCEHIPLRAVAKDAIAEGIGSKDVPDEQAHLIASIAQGRPRLALQYLDDPSLLESRVERIEKLAEILHSSRGERFTFIEKFLPKVQERVDLDTQRIMVLELLQSWMGIWHDALQRSYNPGVTIGNADQIALIEKLGRTLTSREIKNCIKAIQEAKQAIERSANIRLTLEVLMLEIPSL